MTSINRRMVSSRSCYKKDNLRARLGMSLALSQTFIKNLLCACPCANNWAYNYLNSYFQGAYILMLKAKKSLSSVN